MTSPVLPKFADPLALAKSNSTLRGTVLLKNLPRVQAIYNQQNQFADVTLQFGRDAATLFIKGHLRAALHLCCERCGKSMVYPIDMEFTLSPVSSDAQIKNLNPLYEAVVMENELVSVMELVEDEILLALPMVAKHEDVAVCGAEIG